MLIKIQGSESTDGINLTKKMLEVAHINIGEDVIITILNGRIIIETSTQAQKRIELESLIDQIPDDYEPEELEWGKPIGNEEW